MDMKKTLLFLLSIVSLSLIAQDASTERVKAYLTDEVLSGWNIPGVAIAIVKDGEVVFAEGMGMSNTESEDKVTANTLFAVASNTKAFTVAALAQLVEAGELSWDDRVVDHVPYFELYDPYVTRECRVRDLLCHRVGLNTFSGDLLWFASELSREEVIRGAKDLEPVRGFRSGYGYQNIMYMVAGEVIASVSGMPWEHYIQKEFLTPLGMGRTLTSIEQLDGVSDVSAPHNDVKGKNLPIEWSNWDNMGPAGSLISSANDMSRWLLLQLNQGSLDEKEYFSEKSQHEMWTIHTPKKLSGFHRSNFPSKHFSGYGLGWDLFDYHGRMVVNHGGGYDGFISQSCLVPEEELGFIILTNNNSYFAWSMMYQILDIYLNPDGVEDFPAKMLEYKLADEKEKQEKEKALQASRIKKTTPSLDKEAYVGEYVDANYGTVFVSMEGDNLYLRMEPTPLFHGKLEHWHYDTYRLVWAEQHMLPDGMVTFQLDKQAKIVSMDISCPNPDLYFYELDLKKVEDKP